MVGNLSVPRIYIWRRTAVIWVLMSSLPDSTLMHRWWRELWESLRCGPNCACLLVAMLRKHVPSDARHGPGRCMVSLLSLWAPKRLPPWGLVQWKDWGRKLPGLTPWCSWASLKPLTLIRLAGSFCRLFVWPEIVARPTGLNRFLLTLLQVRPLSRLIVSHIPCVLGFKHWAGTLMGGVAFMTCCAPFHCLEFRLQSCYIGLHCNGHTLLPLIQPIGSVSRVLLNLTPWTQGFGWIS